MELILLEKVKNLEYFFQKKWQPRILGFFIILIFIFSSFPAFYTP